MTGVDPIRLGREIRRRRQNVGLSVNAFAKVCHVYRDTLYALERGEKKTPRHTTIKAVEKALIELEEQQGLEPEGSLLPSPTRLHPAQPGPDAQSPAGPAKPVLRFRAEGVYGRPGSIEIECPADNLDVFIRLIDRVMDNLRNGPPQAADTTEQLDTRTSS